MQTKDQYIPKQNKTKQINKQKTDKKKYLSETKSYLSHNPYSFQYESFYMLYIFLHSSCLTPLTYTVCVTLFQLPSQLLSSSSLILVLLQCTVCRHNLHTPWCLHSSCFFLSSEQGQVQTFVSKHVEGINWLQCLALSSWLLLQGCHLAPLLFLLHHFSFSHILTPPYVHFFILLLFFLFPHLCALVVSGPPL